MEQEKTSRTIGGMRLRLLVAVALLAFAGLTASARPRLSVGSARRSADKNWVAVSREEMDMEAISPLGMDVLNLPDIEWKHAQTDHFVIHYEHAMFARKVARMAEFFYEYIGDDLEGVEDKTEGRSHIFVFRNDKKWEDFLEAQPRVPEWAFSLVAGTVMCLQKDTTTTSSGGVLAHETTHLVLNRFFKYPPPLWLNEGLAEYYGEFAYYAFKGIKRSKRTRFRRLKNPLPTRALLYSTGYPKDAWGVESYYDTAKYLVGFFLLEHPPEIFQPFMERLMTGQDPINAICYYYKYETFDDFNKAFRDFYR